LSTSGVQEQRGRATPRVVHPFILAAFPVFSLLSSYVNSVPMHEAYRPALAAVCIALALNLFLRPVLHDAHKRGLAISVLLAFFFGYGALVGTLRRLIVLNGARALVLAAIAAVVGAAALYGLRRVRRDLSGVTSFLNKASVVAIIIPLCMLAVKHVRDMRGAERLPVPANTIEGFGTESHSTPSNEPPNIYFIILDAYARKDILADHFHFDNTEFLSSLKDRGFGIPEKARSNYCWTYLSLSATLNLDYLNPLVQDGEPVSRFLHDVMTQFQNSRVSAMLRSRGYEIVSFSSGYAATEVFDADVRKSPRVRLTEFENVLINMTPLRVPLNRMSDPWQYFLRRRQILYTLDQLPLLTPSPRPRFVFAHIVAPHPPFVLDAQGRPTHAPRPYGLLDGADFYALGGAREEYAAGYIEQLKYLNQCMIAVIDGILAASPNSVIILQGDHGSKSRFTEQVETTDLREAFSILDAIYLPGLDASALLHEDTSSVNTFRIVFNQLFNTRYPLLPEKSYFCRWLTPHQFLDVTDRLQ
jgi:hypothetical protein